MQNQLLINGELVAGEGEKQAVYNPATGDVLLEIAEASEAQVDAAVQAADRAFTEWGQTTPKTRAECLLKLADVIEANADAFANLESLNCGKPLHCVGGRDPGRGRCVSLLCRGRPLPERAGCRRIPRRTYFDDPPRPGWRCRLYCAPELSSDDGGVEAGARAGGGKLCRHQAV